LQALTHLPDKQTKPRRQAGQHSDCSCAEPSTAASVAVGADWAKADKLGIVKTAPASTAEILAVPDPPTADFIISPLPNRATTPVATTSLSSPSDARRSSTRILRRSGPCSSRRTADCYEPPNAGTRPSRRSLARSRAYTPFTTTANSQPASHRAGRRCSSTASSRECGQAGMLLADDGGFAMVDL
jgi:hypothetical protein